METASQKLAGVGSGALCPIAPTPLPLFAGPASLLCEQLIDLLTVKNGFYAFESALHVFPSGRTGVGHHLEQWNSIDGWRCAYGNLTDNLIFFAEDIFGDQFALGPLGVMRFNAETARTSVLALTIEDWAELVLQNYEEETGYPLAHQWQLQYGPLPQGQRLNPKRPFVMGGAYAVENLTPVDAAEGMKFRGEIAVQIHDLPDGATIDIEFTDD